MSQLTELNITAKQRKFAELLVRYSGISNIGFYAYLFIPIIFSPILYLILLNNFWKELR